MTGVGGSKEAMTDRVGWVESSNSFASTGSSRQEHLSKVQLDMGDLRVSMPH